MIKIKHKIWREVPFQVEIYQLKPILERGEWLGSQQVFFYATDLLNVCI